MLTPAKVTEVQRGSAHPVLIATKGKLVVPDLVRESLLRLPNPPKR